MKRGEQSLNSKRRMMSAGYFGSCQALPTHIGRGRLIKVARLFTLVLLLGGTVAVRADKIDDYVKAEMQKQHVPGLSLAVIKDGKIIKVEGYGLANVELNVSARPETVYKIGSVSKQFIATGIMLLMHEGRINLDDK